MKPRCLLVDGVFHEDITVPSLGVAAVAAYVRKMGLSVDMFAPIITHMDEADTAEHIKRIQPSFLGVSLLTRHSYLPFLKLVSLLDRSGIRPFLFVGGHFASLAYEEILREIPDLDCVVIGDGEETCAELLSCLYENRSWKGLNNLAYRNSAGRVHFNVCRPSRDLDEYPMMARDFLEKLIKQYGKNVRVSVISSRGCYAHCSYCSVPAYCKLTQTKPYRLRSIDLLVDEIATVQRKFGVVNFAIEDDNFLMPGAPGIQRVRKFNRAICKSGVKINLFLQTRPECITYEAIRLLAETGLSDIDLGTESFDQDTLDLYQRNNTVEDTVRAFQVLESLGFSARVGSRKRIRIGSIVFHPYVTLEALKRQTSYFARFGIPAKKLVKRLFNADGAELCRRFKEEGLLNEDNTYEFLHKEVGEVYHALKDFFGRHMPLRDDIRRVEKIAQLQNLDLDLADLKRVRSVIDATCASLYATLCEVGDVGKEAIDHACKEHEQRLCDRVNLAAVVPRIRRYCDDLQRFTIHD